ncbi:MAG: GGDEF domain-containing protein, partial [Gammaproteobacteria bacterium]|nr:GGDEF domain-containing protein [Gammaproteobacteria bacterium]
MKHSRLSTEEFIPLMLSAAGAIGVLPFAIIRLLNGEWLIGIFDSAVVLSFVALGVSVLRTHRVRLASVALSALCVLGVIATVYLRGPMQVFWAYPATLAVFYLLLPREAVAASAFLILALVPALLNTVPAFVVTSVLITLLVNTSFAYAFAVLTNDQRDQLLNLATLDPLTGAGNRRALDDKLGQVIAAHRRAKLTASILMLDLDHFKQVNDEHGHDVGDQILIGVTELIDRRIRVTDKLYRIGGEEFVILTEGDRLEVAARLAEELRALIASSELVVECRVTASLGVAELAPGESPKDWL